MKPGCHISSPTGVFLWATRDRGEKMKATKYLVLLLAAACSPSETSGPGDSHSQTIIEGGVSYRAETAIMESFPVQLRTSVHISNRGNAPVTLTFPDGCLVLLRAYHDSARTTLAYDMGRHYGCTLALAPVTIDANGTRTLSTPTISAREILGSSLPNGTYYFSAVLRPDGKTLNIPAGSAELAQ